MKHEIETKFAIGDEVFIIDNQTYIPFATCVYSIDILLDKLNTVTIYCLEYFNVHQKKWAYEKFLEMDVFSSFTEAELVSQRKQERLSRFPAHPGPFSSLAGKYRKRWVGGKYVDELI